MSKSLNVKDKEAINAIVQYIVREKLKSPEQAERMITIEKEQVESFQMYCSDHDILVNSMESKGGENAFLVQLMKNKWKQLWKIIKTSQ